MFSFLKIAECLEYGHGISFMKLHLQTSIIEHNVYVHGKYSALAVFGYVFVGLNVTESYNSIHL